MKEQAPAGYRARPQIHAEKRPLGLSSCEGCAFEHETLSGGSPPCADRPCSRFEREDGQDVIFEKIE